MVRPGVLCAALFAALACAAPAGAVPTAGPGATTLAGPAEATGAQAATGVRTVSDTGRWVVFSAVLGGGVRHIVRQDLLTGTTVTVDRADGPDGAVGTADANHPSISADGNVVAFATAAPLDPAVDTNGVSDVYVRDIVAGTTTLVSRRDGPAGVVGDQASDFPSISGDGTRVAWQSAAINLGDGAVAGLQIHLRDLFPGTTTLVSRADGAAGAPGDGISEHVVLNQEGTVAAFETTAKNLADGDTDTTRDVHVRALLLDRTELVSRGTGGAAKGDGASVEPSISADGDVVAFRTKAKNLVAADADLLDDVYVRARTAGTTTLVSRADGVSGAKANAPSQEPALSADGTTVAFRTKATNLTGVPSGGLDQVYVRSLSAGSTSLASRVPGVTGAAASGDALTPGLNGDGSCALFTSDAANLATAAGIPGGTSRAWVRTVRRECPLSAPDTTITGPTEIASGVSPTFTFGSDENGVTFSCQIDAAPFAPCQSPLTITAPAVGPHVLRVRATDPAGLTDPTAAVGDYSVSPVPVPVLSAVSVSHRTFRAGNRSTATTAARRPASGTLVRYTLNVAATVTLTTQRRLSGRVVGGTCRADSPLLAGAPRCVRLVRAGRVVTRAGRPGRNGITYTARFGRHALKRGSYVLTLAATGPTGEQAVPQSVRVTVVPRPR